MIPFLYAEKGDHATLTCHKTQIVSLFPKIQVTLVAQWNRIASFLIDLSLMPWSQPFLLGTYLATLLAFCIHEFELLLVQLFYQTKSLVGSTYILYLFCLLNSWRKCPPQDIWSETLSLSKCFILFFYYTGNAFSRDWKLSKKICFLPPP